MKAIFAVIIFNSVFCRVEIGQCNWTIGCNHTHNQIFRAANDTKSFKLDPQITEFITITIATTAYPTKLRSFQNGGIFTLDNFSTRDIFSNKWKM